MTTDQDDITIERSTRPPLVSMQFLQVWIPIVLMVASGYFLQDNRVAVIEAEISAIKTSDISLKAEVESLRKDERELEKIAERLLFMVNHVSNQSDATETLQADLHKIVAILQDRDTRAAKIIEDFDQRIRALERHPPARK